MTLYRGPLMPYVLLVYVLSSAICFVAFGLDKRAAMRGGWRIRESTLHFLELLGGFPGALLGQMVFRHKSSKTRYIIVLWLIVALHLIVWAWWIWSRFRR